MIFLASPYSNPDPEVVQHRYRLTFHFTALHLNMGRPVFSPIVYAHPIAEHYYMQTTAAAWLSFNESMLERAEVVWVLTLDGWKDSIGVAGEIKHANRLGIPVIYKEALPL